MNPCPCGFFGDDFRACRCTPVQMARYQNRLSGPLRDRLDMTVDVPALPPDAMRERGCGESSAAVRARVVAARARQLARYAGTTVRSNAELPPAFMMKHCALDAPGARLLGVAAQRVRLTGRGYDRVRKVARTIADLAEAEVIGAPHVAEALQYRSFNEVMQVTPVVHRRPRARSRAP